MRKFLLTVFVMFIGVINVYALEKSELEFVSKSRDTVTLRVNVDNVKDGDVCYIYRSLDDVNYDKKMMVNCNKMYVDKSVSSGVTYYYKASVGRKNEYSNVVTVILEEPDGSMSYLGRNILSKSNIFLVFVAVMFLIACIFVATTYFCRKKLS